MEVVKQVIALQVPLESGKRLLPEEVAGEVGTRFLSLEESVHRLTSDSSGILHAQPEQQVLELPHVPGKRMAEEAVDHRGLEGGNLHRLLPEDCLDQFGQVLG